MSNSQDDVLALPTPTAFPAFPYVPYTIQFALMQHLYSAIESSKVAIIESPTGTGKTLSLLCGSLTWLNDEKHRARKGELSAFRAQLKVEDEPAWVLEQTVARHKEVLEAKDEEMNARIAKARAKEDELRKLEGQRARKRRRIEVALEEVDEESFLPVEEPQAGDALLAQTRELLDTVMRRMKPKHTDIEDDESACTKIFYSSRTHSQLSQLVAELRKTTLGSSTRAVALGSRKNLCINHELRRRVGGDLDEACRELLNDKKGKGCPFLPSPEEETKMLEFRDHILAVPKDIEDLAVLGEELKTCPYYASRRAIGQSELVTLPYNLLLQKSAREALDIDLKGHIVIIDEAHNLIDTVLGIHSLSLSTETVRICLHQLDTYVTRFRKRLAARHLLHLQRLLTFLKALAKFCSEWQTTAVSSDAKGPRTEVMMTVAQVMQALGQKVEGVNLIEICAYLKESKIARKISGYNDKLDEDKMAAGAKSNVARKVNPPLHAVEAFVLALMNNDEDGRIHLSQTSQNGTSITQLRYQLLNPARHFEDVVREARSVVLAGGTMEPISDFRTQLFPQLDEDRISSLKCGHIIPQDNLTAIAIASGPRGGELTFKYASRGDNAVMAELGQTILNLVNLVPEGMVVFVSSYAFLGQIKEAWAGDGTLTKLGAKKRIFFEPQETGTVEEVLREYAQAIRIRPADGSAKKGGALLFAVVGAKLSEGLNFSDELARAVVVVGLPFANLGSVELKERMKYVREVSKKTPGNGGKDAGLELYENICMKAVNQSIGRAIRHKDDWAALILLDKRYSSPQIRKKLPQWINEQMHTVDRFGVAVGHLGAFYRRKQKG